MRVPRLLAATAITAVAASALVTTPAAFAAPVPAPDLNYTFDTLSGTLAAGAAIPDTGVRTPRADGVVRNGGVTVVPGVTGAADDKAIHLTGGRNDADAVASYIELPDDIVSSTDTAVTVSVWTKWGGADNGNCQLVFGLGRSTTKNLLSSTSCNGTYGAVSDAPNGERRVGDGGAALPVNHWANVTLVFQPGQKVSYYVNGQLDGGNAEATGIGHTIDAALGQNGVGGYLGRSFWDDPYYAGALDDVRIWTTALSADEIRTAGADQYAALLASESVSLGDTSHVDRDLTLPMTADGGSTVTWATSDASVVAADGTVTRPSASDGDATVQLTPTFALGGRTRTGAPIDVTVVALSGTAQEEAVQGREPLHGVGQHLDPLARREAHERRVVPAVCGRGEGGERDADDTRARRQLATERVGVGGAERSGIHDREIRPARGADVESGGTEARAEQLGLGLHLGGDRGEERVGEPEARGDRRLEGRAADVGEELLHGEDRRDQFGRAGHPAGLPPGEREGLPGGRDRHRALGGAREGRDRHVRAVEDEVLVHLVGDDDRVVPVREPHDLVEHLTREHRTGRVVRIVDEDHARPVGDRGCQDLEVGLEVGPPQGHRNQPRTRERHARGIGVVVRLEHHDLVVGAVDQGEERRGEGLRSADGHEHLARGIELDPVEPPLVLGDRLEQIGETATRGVLVDAVGDGAAGGLQDGLGAVLVGEALPEVERARGGGERGHLGEDRGNRRAVGGDESRAEGGAAPGAGEVVHEGCLREDGARRAGPKPSHRSGAGARRGRR